MMSPASLMVLTLDLLLRDTWLSSSALIDSTVVDLFCSLFLQMSSNPEVTMMVAASR